MTTQLKEIQLDTTSLERETDLIGRFSRDVEKQGLVGETKNAVVTFLAAVSAKLTNPLQVTIYGESSSGKNHLMNSVSEFIPEESKKTLTGMTAKSLMHSAENEFRHKVVFIAEYEGVSKADFSIRTFQSEKSIEWDFVDTKKGIQKKTKKVRGPASFIQATTRSVLHPENETRLLFIKIDPSAEQTAEIIKRQAKEAANSEQPVGESNSDIWRAFIQKLEPDMKVITPFAEQIVEHFPASRVRSRRDFPKLLALIETSAYLHQHQRQRIGNSIVANEDDYRTAKQLFEHCYSFGPDSTLQELLKATKTLESEFRIPDVMGVTGWGKTKTYDLIDRAEEIGCIAESETKGTYRHIRDSAIPPLNLPDKLTVL
jgi:ABC-type dipeptide/oligopeptide/nickel transport system ATPase component